MRGPAVPAASWRPTPAPAIDPESDPFADGHEDRTPPELFALRPNGAGPDTPGWQVRVVPNLYPALEPDSEAPPAARQPRAVLVGPRDRRARGDHQFPASRSARWASWRPSSSRPRWTSGASGCASTATPPCLHLIVNERREAGASLPHTHAQLYALEFVPAAIARERERFGAYATQTMGGNLLADLVQQEVRERERIVAIDDEAVLLSAYAGRVPYQLMIAPRTPRARFEDDGPTGAALLDDALRRLARRLGASPPLNLWVRTAPQGAEHFCWRIDILPRLDAPRRPRAGRGRQPQHRRARAGRRRAARRVAGR